MLASQEGRVDVAELLIEHDADVNARTEVRLYTHDYIELKEVIRVTLCAYVYLCVQFVCLFVNVFTYT